MKHFIIILFIFAIAPIKAYAYLDPGSGSYIVQIIVASLVGGLLTMKVFFTRLKMFFRKLFVSAEQDKETTEKNENS
jgi:hypothetical protein